MAHDLQQQRNSPLDGERFTGAWPPETGSQKCKMEGIGVSHYIYKNIRLFLLSYYNFLTVSPMYFGVVDNI